MLQTRADTGFNSGCCEIMKRKKNFEKGKKGKFSKSRKSKRKRGENGLLS